MKLPKQILYIDMDNVLVDSNSAFSSRGPEEIAKLKKKDAIPDSFALMKPLQGAIEAFERLSELFDIYILTTAPWGNPSAWIDKLHWVKRFLGNRAHERLILSHHKNLNRGDYLLSDRLHNGELGFEGELIHFSSDTFPDWLTVVSYLEKKAGEVLEKFKALPEEKESLTTLREFIKIGNLRLLHEKWCWEGVNGETLIFDQKDVTQLNRDNLTKIVRVSGLVKDEGLIEINDKTPGFIFANFNGELAD
jgi:5'(3')-deoxyribonucleotidase